MTTRLLGEEHFGIFTYLITVSAVIAAFFEMGLDLQIVRLISPEKNNASRYTETSVFLRLTGVVAMLITAMVLYYSMYTEKYTPPVYAMGILQGVFLFILSHLRAIFRSMEILKYEAISIACEKLLVAALGFFILFASADLLQFLIFYNIGSFIALLISLGFVYKLTGVFLPKIPSVESITQVLKPARTFAVLNIIQVAYTRLGTLVLERMTGNLGWVGFHNAGARFSDAFVVFPNIIMAAIYPVMCRVQNDVAVIWHLTQLTSRMLLALAVPIGTTIFIANYEFTSLVFGSQYIQAASAIGVFGLTLIATSQVFIVGSVVSATGNQPKANYLLIGAFVISLTLYIVFIPTYGFIGAAWITFIDQVMLFGLNYWVTRSFYRFREYLLNILRAIAFPAIAFFVYQDVELDLHPLVLILAIMAWNFLGTLVMGLIKKSDIDQLLKLRKQAE
jgi:O-antigen/teichoic acid export membrane protein